MKKIFFDEGTPVAIDNGRHSNKIAYWVEDSNGKRQIFKNKLVSRAQQGAIHEQGFGLEAKQELFDTSQVYEVNGCSWTVGKAATKANQITSIEFDLSDENALLINHTLLVSGFGGHEIMLSTGVPYAFFWSSQGVKNETFIQQIKDKVSGLNAVPFNSTLKNSGKVTTTNHTVYPESLAAFIDWKFDEEGNEVNTVQQGITIVDIGGGTTDICTFDSDNNVKDEYSGTIEFGILKVKDNLKLLLYKEYGFNYESAMLDRIIETGSCMVSGEMKDHKEHLKDAQKETLNQIIQFVKNTVNKHVIDFILFVGGGAAVLRDEILSLKDDPELAKLEIGETPEYANVSGILKHQTFFVLSQTKEAA